MNTANLLLTNNINITGLKSNGQILSANFEIDGLFDGIGGISDFKLFAFNWSDLIRVDFNSVGFSFDNITVSTVLVDVPEPPTLVLFGLGIFGLLIKRRKQQ